MANDDTRKARVIWRTDAPAGIGFVDEDPLECDLTPEEEAELKHQVLASLNAAEMKALRRLGLTCGAKTRAGTACKRRDIQCNGRCRLHGGLSTGPKTAEGLARVTQNLPHRRGQSS
jgi:hypothetical protein